MSADPFGGAIAPLDRPLSLSQQAYDTIQTELLAGRWSSDERLTEQMVAERLSISRTPAREALRRLVLMGSLESLPGGGYVQRTLSPRAVREHCELRLVVEPDAAAMAAARGRSNLDALLALPEARERATSPAHDMRLHIAIGEASGNAVLAGLIRTLNERTAVHRLYSDAHGAGVRAQLLDGHREILAALDARDARAAYSAMTQHLRLEHDLLCLEPHER